MSDYRKVLAALLVGAAAGAVLGVLFAPDKGEKTRKNIVKLAKKNSEKLEELVDESMEYAKRKVAEAKDKASKLASNIQHSVTNFSGKSDDLKDMVKPGIDEIKGRVKHEVS